MQHALFLRFRQKQASVICSDALLRNILNCVLLYLSYYTQAFPGIYRFTDEAFASSAILVPAAFYLPGQSPAKYCRR
jgi:hypothetical protein